MLSLGDIVAPPEVRPADWVRALAGRAPLALAPASGRGWFSGRALVAWDPSGVLPNASFDAVGAALESAFDSSSPVLSAALIGYEGDCTIALYPGGVMLGEDGWRAWGSSPAMPPEGEFLLAPRCAPLDASAPLLVRARSDLGAREYRSAVARVRERIVAGDVYVLNLTYRVRGEPVLEPSAAFATLIARAEGDFSACLEWPGTTALVSVSPERFLRIARDDERRTAEIWPIKGTHPRGATAQADEALASELVGDPKERAEHIMVVDLERNDLGRVCVPGTIKVDPLYEVFQTPYCHQLVSAVRGELRADTRFADVIEATFPSGSVTGAPKIAAMRIAAELERSPRGAYCGSLLVAVPGELDSSVLIRTLEYGIPASGGSAVGLWGTGCGITAESDVAAEWLESVLKASPVMGDGLPGQPLLETCRVARGRVPLMDRHLARLAQGGCGPTLLSTVRMRASDAVRDWDRTASYGRLRVRVDRDGHVEAAVDARRSTLEVTGGPTLVPFVVEIAPSLPSGAAKPAERAIWDLAHATAIAAGGGQAVLIMPDGTLLDGSTATIWLRVGRRLLTPPAPPAVDGIARGVIFDAARDLGYEASQESLTVHDLERADEVFLSNALAGVVPVLGRAGEACNALEDVFRGVCSE